MKKLITIGLCAMFAFTATITVTTKFFSNSKAELILSNIQSLTFDEIVDGGTLPPAVVTCDTGGSGRCYTIHVEEGLYGACRFDCETSDDPDDYCCSWYIDLVNFCSAMSAC